MYTNRQIRKAIQTAYREHLLYNTTSIPFCSELENIIIKELKEQ